MIQLKLVLLIIAVFSIYISFERLPQTFVGIPRGALRWITPLILGTLALLALMITMNWKFDSDVKTVGNCVVIVVAILYIFNWYRGITDFQIFKRESIIDEP